MIDTEKEKIYKEIFIGSVALISLLILMTPMYFYRWITLEFFVKAVAIFFVLPMAYVFIDLKFPREVIVVFGIGGILFIIYSYIFGLTLEASIILMLKTVVEIVFISVIIIFFHKWFKKRIPP